MTLKGCQMRVRPSASQSRHGLQCQLPEPSLMNFDWQRMHERGFRLSDRGVSAFALSL